MTLGIAASSSTSGPTMPRMCPGASSVRKSPIAIAIGAPSSSAKAEVVADEDYHRAGDQRRQQADAEHHPVAELVGALAQEADLGAAGGDGRGGAHIPRHAMPW